MKVQVIKSTLQDIQSFRTLFLEESNIQFVYNKCHLYGWSDEWLFLLDDTAIGYGSVWGTDNRKDRDTIFEFYILEAYRKYDMECFSGLLEQSGAIWIECQTNDKLLSSMLFQCSKHIIPDCILFEDYFPTSIVLPGIVFSKQETKDNEREDVLEYILTQNDVVVATGGLMLNYNEPFADLYMEVMDGYRNQGLGALMVQELKRACYGIGRVLAARCNIDNKVSKATLLHAGMRICGFIVKGKLTYQVFDK